MGTAVEDLDRWVMHILKREAPTALDIEAIAALLKGSLIHASEDEIEPVLQEFLVQGKVRRGVSGSWRATLMRTEDGVQG